MREFFFGFKTHWPSASLDVDCGKSFCIAVYVTKYLVINRMKNLDALGLFDPCNCHLVNSKGLLCSR